MGRELRRKEEHKNKNKKREVVEEKISAIYGLKIVGAVLILLVSLYFVLAVFITKEINIITSKEEVSESANQDSSNNDRILAASIFKQKEEEYYVLVYDTSDTKTMLGNWKSKYEGTKDALKVYVVNPKVSLNNKYIVNDNSNTSPTGYQDLKIKAPTLIKISSKSVTEYIEGENEIKNVFNK